MKRNNNIFDDSLCKIYFSSRILEMVFLFSFLFVFSSQGWGQVQATDTYTVTGTWTAPTGVTSVIVECWGGGGGGGGASGNPATGGGGAGGSYVKSVLAVVSGTAYPVTVGNAKTATTTSSAASNKGNPSWFNTAGTIYAAGGDGGTPASVNSTNGASGVGNTTGCIGTTQYAGGNGSVGDYTSGSGYSGAGGGGAGSIGTGGNAVAGTGGTGTTLSGGNGANGVGNSTAGVIGSSYGGGGSGGKANGVTDRAGGTGAQGLVIITYTVNNAIFNGGIADGFSLSCAGGSGTEIPLPIELLSFTGKCDNENIVLRWSTATEINNNYFSIEHSTSALNWIIIGTVNGAGNSSSLRSYSLTDIEPYNGISYYRLKQTDFDGKFQYFNIIAIKNCEDDFTELIIYPNPTNGIFNCIFNGDKEQIYLIEIYNAFCKIIYSSDSYQSVIDLSNKQNGIYCVRFFFRTKTITKIIIIESG